MQFNWLNAVFPAPTCCHVFEFPASSFPLWSVQWNELVWFPFHTAASGSLLVQWDKAKVGHPSHLPACWKLASPNSFHHYLRSPKWPSNFCWRLIKVRDQPPSQARVQNDRPVYQQGNSDQLETSICWPPMSVWNDFPLAPGRLNLDVSGPLTLLRMDWVVRAALVLWSSNSVFLHLVEP